MLFSLNCWHRYHLLCLSAVGHLETGVHVVARVEPVSRPGRCAAWGRWPIRGRRWWHTPCAPSSPQLRSSPVRPRTVPQNGALDPGHRWVCGSIRYGWNSEFMANIGTCEQKWKYIYFVHSNVCAQCVCSCALFLNRCGCVIHAHAVGNFKWKQTLCCSLQAIWRSVSRKDRYTLAASLLMLMWFENLNQKKQDLYKNDNKLLMETFFFHKCIIWASNKCGPFRCKQF